MKFKDFKKVVIAYFAGQYIKSKYIKKMIAFEYKKKEAGTPCWAYFKYAGRSMRLKYISGNWYLFIEGTNKDTFLKTGFTINECCDFLWQNKTPETILKNWYI